MEQIRSLEHTDRNTLYDTFREAFKDYPVHWSREAFDYMLQRRGVSPEISFGAFDENKLVSFTLNSIGIYDDVLAAYDSGTGTIEPYRGKGLASSVFEASLPALRQKGAKQYLLEVLKDNEKAIRVYRSIGFGISRSLDYYKQERKLLTSVTIPLPEEYSIRATGIPDEQQAKTFWDFIPSWQNTYCSIRNLPEAFRSLGVFYHTQLVGYGIIEVTTGDIPQLAIHKQHRNKHLGSILLKKLLQFSTADTIRFANAADGNDQWKAFMRKNGLPKIADQYEMIREL